MVGFSCFYDLDLQVQSRSTVIDKIYPEETSGCDGVDGYCTGCKIVARFRYCSPPSGEKSCNLHVFHI